MFFRGIVFINNFDISHYVQKTTNIFLFTINLQTFDNFVNPLWDLQRRSR